MKHTMLLFACLLTASFSFSQIAATDPDKSPMDMSYSPQNYPILKFQNKGLENKVNARVIYSRPQVKGRTIFGGEIKYNELWRIGANEATELQLYKNTTIGGKKLPKGRYTMYCIPKQDKWTIIINKDLDCWGGFSYKPEMDVLRTEVPVQATDSPVEFLTIYFDNPNNLVVMWENAKVNLPMQFDSK